MTKALYDTSSDDLYVATEFFNKCFPSYIRILDVVLLDYMNSIYGNGVYVMDWADCCMLLKCSKRTLLKMIDRLKKAKLITLISYDTDYNPIFKLKTVEGVASENA